MGFNFDDFKAVLQLSIDDSVTDIFFKVGLRPTFKRHGRQIITEFDSLQPIDLRLIVEWLLPTKTEDEIDNIMQMDFAYSQKGIGRFRVNVCRENGELQYFGIVMRAIPLTIKTFEELNLSNKLSTICARSGLVLVTGATGMGKSTTLAAMLKSLYTENEYHIIALEDPIEYEHIVTKGILTQREYRTNFLSYKEGIDAALRESPDVIVVGEIRNAESLDAVLHAAELGIKVFSAIHTESAVSTLQKIVTYYGDDEKANIASRLSMKLNAIISLKLLKKDQDSGRLPAMEILVNENTITKHIEKRNWEAIAKYMEEATETDLAQTFDQDIKRLYLNKKISYGVALAAVNRPFSIEDPMSMFKRPETNQVSNYLIKDKR